MPVRRLRLGTVAIQDTWHRAWIELTLAGLPPLQLLAACPHAGPRPRITGWLQRRIVFSSHVVWLTSSISRGGSYSPRRRLHAELDRLRRISGSRSMNFMVPKVANSRFDQWP